MKRRELLKLAPVVAVAAVVPAVITNTKDETLEISIDYGDNPPTWTEVRISQYELQKITRPPTFNGMVELFKIPKNSKIIKMFHDFSKAELVIQYVSI